MQKNRKIYLSFIRDAKLELKKEKKSLQLI